MRRSKYEGKPIVAPTIKCYPPDTTAAIFWLKNRQPGMWRDKQEVEHGGDIAIAVLTADEYKQARKEMLEQDNC